MSSSSDQSSESSSSSSQSSEDFQEYDENKQVYCICRKPADGEFMIQCDACKEWFHGNCINLKESDSSDIANYFCPSCRHQNPTKFRIKYKQSKKSKLILLQTHIDLTTHNICFGPGCTNKKLNDSKYCSTECGQALARKRVQNLLPKIKNSIKCHVYPSIKSNNAQLLKILQDLTKNKNELAFLEQKLDQLECVAETADQFRQVFEVAAEHCASGARENHVEIDGYNNNYEEQQVFCPVCGVSLGSNLGFTKHVEMCYRKIERLLTFESSLPSRIKTRHKLYCDEFDSKTRHYCKRLWVSCPEHTRRPKQPHNEACAYPLDDSFTVDFAQRNSDIKENTTIGVSNNFIFHSTNFDPVTFTAKRRKLSHSETPFPPPTSYPKPSDYTQQNEPFLSELPTSPKPPPTESQNLIKNFGKIKFCKLSKKICNRHFNWEHTFRAALDVQRARIYNKIEELTNLEIKYKIQEATRYDMWNMLSHKIIRHDLEQKESSEKDSSLTILGEHEGLQGGMSDISDL